MAVNQWRVRTCAPLITVVAVAGIWLSACSASNDPIVMVSEEVPVETATDNNGGDSPEPEPGAEPATTTTTVVATSMTLTDAELAAVEELDELFDKESEDFDFDAFNDPAYQAERDRLIQVAFNIAPGTFTGPLDTFHNEDRTVTQFWMDYRDPDRADATYTGGVTVMVDDIAVSVPWWYDVSALRYTWPAAVQPDKQQLDDLDLGPQLLIGEPWDLPAEGLVVSVAGAFVIYDEAGTTIGHIPTTAASPKDGTPTDWFATAGRELVTLQSAPLGEQACFAFSGQLESCTVDGVAQLAVAGQTIVEPVDWEPLLAPHGITKPPGESWLIEHAINGAAYNSDLGTWILQWNGVYNDVDCWRSNTMVLNDTGEFGHISAGPINANPPATPIGWVGDAIAYGIYEHEPTDCSPGSDTNAIYLNYPDGTTTTILEGGSLPPALTFTTS